MEVDRNGLEALHRDERLRLLGTATIGRVAVTSGALRTCRGVPRWVPGRDGRFVAIATDLVSGRRIVPGLGRDAT